MLVENQFIIKENGLTEYVGEEICIVLPQNVEIIAKGAFESKPRLERVEFANSVKKVGERAFARCVNLKEIVLNPSLKRLSEGCFEGCTALKEITLPDSIVSIRAGAFRNCVNLSEIHLPTELRRCIEQDTFSACRILRRIVIPAGVEWIGFRAFCDCENLEEVIFENKNIQIERGAFVGCRALNEETKRFIAEHTFSRVVVDVRSSSPGAAGRLSNFTARSFVFDGVQCGSVEGVLQSFKCADVVRQQEICALSGNEARMAGREYDWREAQVLYWQGASYPRESTEYQQLITRLYDAVYAQDESFRADIACVRGREITHRLGGRDVRKTILTRTEFEEQLMRLAE